MEMIYDPAARGYHWHMLSVGGIARRVYLMGFSAEIFWRKVEDRGGFIRQKLRSLLSWGASTPPAVGIWERLRRKRYQENRQYSLQWHLLLVLSFFIGLQDARRKRPVRADG
jgi:hypothetical protein